MCTWSDKRGKCLVWSPKLNWGSIKVLIWISTMEGRLWGAQGLWHKGRKEKYCISEQIECRRLTGDGLWDGDMKRWKQNREKNIPERYKNSKWDPFLLRWCFFFKILIIFLIFAFTLNTSVCNLREKQDILSLPLKMFYKIHSENCLTCKDQTIQM